MQHVTELHFFVNWLWVIREIDAHGKVTKYNFVQEREVTQLWKE